jgi:hypothetical protein
MKTIVDSEPTPQTSSDDKDKNDTNEALLIGDYRKALDATLDEIMKGDNDGTNRRQ